MPETTFTVWHNVFERGGLRPGEWLLVHGGASGIGTTAIQLAKAFGAFVVATAGTDEKCKALKQLGADHAINYKSTDFVEATIEASLGHGADVILDMVGGDYLCETPPPPLPKEGSCRYRRSRVRKRRSTSGRS